MAELSEDDRRAILGTKYRPPDPDAAGRRPSLLRRIWASLTGKSGKS